MRELLTSTEEQQEVSTSPSGQRAAHTARQHETAERNITMCHNLSTVSCVIVTTLVSWLRHRCNYCRLTMYPWCEMSSSRSWSLFILQKTQDYASISQIPDFYYSPITPPILTHIIFGFGVTSDCFFCFFCSLFFVIVSRLRATLYFI